MVHRGRSRRLAAAAGIWAVTIIAVLSLFSGAIATSGATAAPTLPSTPAFPDPGADATGPSSPQPVTNSTGALGYTWSPIDNTTSPGSVSLPDGGNPFAIAFDPVQGTIWVGFDLGQIDIPYYFDEQVSPELLIVNATTGRGVYLSTNYDVVSAITYDPANRDMYVAEFSLNGYLEANETSYVVVFNASNEQIVNPGIPVGRVPTSIVYIAATNDLWVTDEGTVQVNVISGATNQVVETLGPSNFISGGWGMAYDPVNGDVYIDAFELDTIEVLNATRAETLPYAIPTPGPYGWVAYDPVIGDLFAWSIGFLVDGTAGVELIDPTSQAQLAQIPLPGGSYAESLVVDPVNGNAIMGLSNGEVAILNVTTDAVTAISPPLGGGPWEAALDPAADTVFFTDSFSNYLVPVSVASASEVRAPIPLGLTPDEAVWDPADGRAFITDGSEPGVLEMDPSSGTGDALEVPLGSTGLTSATPAAPGAITYAADVNEVLVGSNATSYLWVLNGTTGASTGSTIPIGFNATALAYSSANGDVYIGTNNSTLLQLDPRTGAVSLVATLPDVPNSLLLDPTTGLAWASGEGPPDDVAAECSGYMDAVYVSNGTTFMYASFGNEPAQSTLDTASDTVYVQTFNVCGNSNPLLAFSSTNGSSESAPYYQGLGAPDLGLAFDPVNDGVYIATAGGYPAIQVLNGTTQASMSIGGATISAEPDPNFLLVDPDDGNVLLLNQYDGIVQGITLAPAILAATATPDIIDLGDATNVSIEASGGAGWFHYSYEGLPDGCPGGNVSNFTCTPTVGGAYLLNVTVTDEFNQSSYATFPLVVRGLPSVAVAASATEALVHTPIGFSANASGGIAPYNVTWKFSDGFTADGLRVSHGFAKPGTYTATATVVDAAGMSGSNRVVVVIGSTFSATALVAPLALTAGSNVSANVTAAGGDAPYYATFLYGDGNRSLVVLSPGSESAQVDHTYDLAGTFLVQVWVNDSGVGSERFEFNVTVASAPAPPPTPPPSNTTPPPKSSNASGATTPSAAIKALTSGLGIADIVVAVALVAIVLLVIRARRRPPGASR